MEGISKSFPGVQALQDVDFEVSRGEIHGLVGENGAGKSTFLKILSGKQEPTSGQVHLEPGKRMSVLEQNHNLYDDYPVLETVLRGNKPLFKIKSGSRDLNPGPQRPERCALASCATSRNVVVYNK